MGDVADRFDGRVRLTEVDSNADPETPSLHRVRGVPTFIAVHDGVEVARAVGSRSPEELTELFEVAVTGDTIQARLSTTDRGMRIVVAGIFAVAAVVTSTPILWVFAAGAVGFATWDLFRR